MTTTVGEVDIEEGARRRPPEAVDAGRPSAKIERFLAGNRLETPFLVLDLDVVADRYLRLAAALPGVRLYLRGQGQPRPGGARRTRRTPWAWQSAIRTTPLDRYHQHALERRQ